MRLYARAANDVRQQLQIGIRHNQFRAAPAVGTVLAGAHAGPMHLECPRALQALLHDQAAALCMWAPRQNTRMSPTCGPISILVAADTMATLLASNAAIKLASTAVLTTSSVGTFLRQRLMVIRIFFMAGPARFAEGLVLGRWR